MATVSTNAGNCSRAVAVFLKCAENLVFDLFSAHHLVTVSGIDGTARSYNIALDNVQRDTTQLRQEKGRWQFEVRLKILQLR